MKSVSYIITDFCVMNFQEEKSVLTQVVLKFKLLISKQIFSKVNAEYIFKNISTIFRMFNAWHVLYRV